MNIGFKLWYFLPVRVKERLMHKIVISGYENNDYLTSARKRDLTEHEKDMIYGFIARTRRLSACPRVLDIGCGDGALFDKFMESDGVRITGIDISDKMIRQANKNLPKQRFIKVDFMRYNARECMMV